MNLFIDLGVYILFKVRKAFQCLLFCNLDLEDAEESLNEANIIDEKSFDAVFKNIDPFNRSALLL